MNKSLQHKRTRTISLLFLVTLSPMVVFANAGSPMMWFGLLHILILNWFIGIAESKIMKHYGLDNREGLIVLANYVSMFIGMNLIAPHFSTLFGNPDFWAETTSVEQYDIGGFVFGMFFSFIATLIIELPFAFFAARQKASFKSVLKPYFLANVATNGVMFLFYFLIIIIPG